MRRRFLSFVTRCRRSRTNRCATPALRSATAVRSLACEPLEDRCLLSIGPYPELPGMTLVDPRPDQFEGQVVYLDFDGAEDLTYDGPVVIDDIDVAAFAARAALAGDEQEIIDAVVARLEGIFAGTGITFTTVKPTDDTQYSTIYIGGNDAAFSAYGSFLGLADSVDVGNHNRSDEAFVFTDTLQTVETTSTSSADALAADTTDLLTHELAHLLGYEHDVIASQERDQGSVLDDVAYGVTIVTHGYGFSTVDNYSWVESMADEIITASGGSDVVAEYTLTVWYDDGRYQSSLDLSSPDNNTVWGSSANTSGEAVIKLDWRDIDGGVSFVMTSTSVVAQYAVDALMSCSSLLSAPIHLIGHSRGGSLVGAIAEQLGSEGIWVDQVTFLDPHPTENGTAEDDWGEGDTDENLLAVPGNVLFADNYYRDQDSSEPNGEPVSGALNVHLDGNWFNGDAIGGYSGYSDTHADVHLWYHGTIDTEGGFDDDDASVSEENAASWYVLNAYDGPSPGERNETGFAYSLIRRGDRPTSGLWEVLGGTTERTFTNDGEWANIGYLELDSYSVAQGGTIDIDYYYDTPDADETTITFYLDNDRNPYNSYVCNLGDEIATLVSNAVTDGGYTGGIPASLKSGTYYAYAAITYNGHTRYFYVSEGLAVSPGQLVVDTLVDEDDGDYSSGDLSLREALALAADEESHPGLDEITFFDALFNEGTATITLAGSQLCVDSNVIISGPGYGILAVDGNQESRVLLVTSTATLSGLTICGGYCGTSGGGILNSGVLTIVDSVVTDNGTASQFVGGGICNSNTLIVIGSTISSNESWRGGGIASGPASSIVPSVRLINSVVVGNASYSYKDYAGNAMAGEGGGIYAYSGELQITNSTIAGNHAQRYGGGIACNTTVVLNNSVITHNDATLGGVDIQGSYSGTACLIGSDPKFVRNPDLGSADLGDLRLKQDSPAIDTGNDALAVDVDGNPLTTDLDGNARISGTSVDIGAYEFNGDANEAPSVSLANTVTTLLEDAVTTPRLKVADIVVSDDGLGTNELSLSGADSGLFEIDGTVLYLKAGTVLDHETNAVLDVTVEVDDTSVGTTPDDTAVLSVTVIDVGADIVTVAVSPASVLEDGSTSLVYTFTRSGDATSALTVNFDVAGGAAYTTDYTQTGAASFDATAGTVTFAADSTAAIVTVSPVADTTIESDETVVLTLASGTGYTVGTPDAATGTIANDDVIPLGPVDFVDLQTQNPSVNDLWYSLQTTHTGLLSLEADNPNVQILLLNELSALLSASALVDGHQRLDWNVNAGENYIVQLSGTVTDVDLLLANLVAQSGPHLTVFGTAGADTFSFDASAGSRVGINGVVYSFGEGELTTISFSGNGDSDTATLQGSAQAENARIWPGKARFTVTGLDVWVYDTETITVHGGGGDDLVRLFDSPETDTFTGNPQSANMIGPGFSNTAAGFRYVYANSGSGGADAAWLYDSTGNDKFTATPTSATMDGPAYSVTASQFRNVHGLATAGGTDNAYLYDSAGDDVYRADGAQGRMFGDDFFVRARYFDNLFTYSLAGGHDTAILNGTSGDDTFYGMPTISRLYGADYYHRVVQYDEVEVYGGSGTDVAWLYDSTGNDSFTVTPTQATMLGPDYSVTAHQFPYAHGLATSGGTDSAYLYDSPGDDTYRADGTQGRMFYESGVFARARYFDNCFTYSTAGGYDRAILNGTAGRDTYYGTPTISRLYGAGYYHRVVQYDDVEVYSGGGIDKADLTDSAGNDYLEAADTWARLSCADIPYSILVNGFNPVTAKSSNIGDKKDVDASVDFLIATGYWEDV